MPRGKKCADPTHTRGVNKRGNCIDCAYEHTRQWYKNNPEKRLHYKRQKYPTPTRPEPPKCECCGKSKPQRRSSIRFHLDHDHKTQIFRGWLCHKCNMGIGLLGDNLLGIQQAVRYLERSAIFAQQEQA